MLSATVRVVVAATAMLAFGTAGQALPPPGTPVAPPPPVVQPQPPPQPSPPPPTSPPQRLPSPSNPVFWLQCPQFPVPRYVSTAPAVSAQAYPPPPQRVSYVDIGRKLDSLSAEFKDLLNRLPASCILNVLPPGQPTDYMQYIYSGNLAFVADTRGTQYETLRFTFNDVKFQRHHTP
jgi:hypothetical protein